jgi:hypothetical protein
MWARMAATFHYQKPEVAVASRIDQYAPQVPPTYPRLLTFQVAEAFISSRMDAVKHAVEHADSNGKIKNTPEILLTTIKR